MATLTICDERPGKEKSEVLTLDCLTETMSVRELIKARVYQEVQDFNRAVETERTASFPRLLVTPTELEARLNDTNSAGQKKNKFIKQKMKVDWEAQFDLACRAFAANSFFVLIGDRQAEDLDEEFQVKVQTEITFLKLVPLVGG